MEEELEIGSGINEVTLEIFKEDTKTFDDLDVLITDLKKKIEPLQKQLKTLTLEKKKLQISICKFMSENNVEICGLPKVNGVSPAAIKYVETTAVVPLTQAQIKESLVKFFNSPDATKLNSLPPSDRGLFLFNYIYAKENRQKTIKSSLKKVEYKKED